MKQRLGYWARVAYALRRVAAAGLVAAILAVAGAGFAGGARADYKACNETSYVIRAAIAYKNGGDYTSAGWFMVYPGHCAVLVDEPLNQHTYFLHGRSAAGHQGPMRHWAGTVRFCTAPDNFTIAGSEDCARRGYDEAMFDAIEVGNSKTWITTFTEPAGYSLQKAGVMGVQRLLADLGYIRADRIDGYDGPGTKRAIQKFTRTYRVNVSEEPSPDLFRELLKAAKEQSGTAGFELCNTAPYPIWAAIGLPLDKAVNTKGWYELQPDECVKPVLEKLTRDFLYVYAETVDAAEKKLFWRGNDNLCANDIVFSITGLPGECSEDGLKSLRFAKIDTEGREKWTHFIKAEDAVADGPN